MPGYNCKIAGKDGIVFEREVQAESSAAVKRTIDADGGFLISIERKDRFSGNFVLGRPALKPREFFSFNHEFLALLRAGIPVVQAFDGIIEKDGAKYLSRVLQHIRDDIADGEAVSHAFEKYSSYFSPLYISALRSGEAAGNIPDAIEKYLDYFERSRAIRQKIKAASVYPAILTVCAVAVIVFLLVFVVPTITGTFVESGANLPFFTTLLLSFSDMVRSWFWMILLGGAVVVAGVVWWIKTPGGRLAFDTWRLRLPFVGELSRVYATSLFASSLSTILAGGTPLNKGLYISKGLIQNRYMQAGIQKAIAAVEDGAGFAPALKEVNVFPDMAIRMIAAGEQGGRLEIVLDDLARFYEKEVASGLTMITSTIEPVLMVLMGFIIGFIMLAMYMPIFQMAGTIG